MNPNPMPKIEHLANNTELAPLSRFWWFWVLVIKENLIFDTFPPTPEHPGDPQKPRKAVDYTTRKGPMNTHGREVSLGTQDYASRIVGAIEQTHRTAWLREFNVTQSSGLGLQQQSMLQSILKSTPGMKALPSGIPGG